MSQAARIKCLWGLSAVFATVALALAILFIMSSALAEPTRYQYNRIEPGNKCDSTGGGAGAECTITEDQCVIDYAEQCTPDQCTR